MSTTHLYTAALDLIVRAIDFADEAALSRAQGYPDTAAFCDRQARSYLAQAERLLADAEAVAA